MIIKTKIISTNIYHSASSSQDHLIHIHSQDSIFEELMNYYFKTERRMKEHTFKRPQSPDNYTRSIMSSKWPNILIDSAIGSSKTVFNYKKTIWMCQSTLSIKEFHIEKHIQKTFRSVP